MRVFFLLFLMVIGLITDISSVMIRHDIPDSEYLELGSDPSFGSIGIVYNQGSYGTGTLIGERLVLTCAHVVYPAERCSFWLYIPEMGKEYHIMGTVLCHPEFIPNSIDSHLLQRADIALLYLDTPIREVTPMPIDFIEDNVCYRYVSVGYGNTGTGLDNVTICDKKKRGYCNEISLFCEGTSFHNMGIAFFVNPESNPSDLDFLKGSGAPGDSGSPILVIRKGGWCCVALLAGGSPEGSSYGTYNAILSLNDYRDWLEHSLL